jgi:hypothetical protein
LADFAGMTAEFIGRVEVTHSRRLHTTNTMIFDVEPRGFAWIGFFNGVCRVGVLVWVDGQPFVRLITCPFLVFCYTIGEFAQFMALHQEDPTPQTEEVARAYIQSRLPDPMPENPRPPTLQDIQGMDYPAAVFLNMGDPGLITPRREL